MPLLISVFASSRQSVLAPLPCVIAGPPVVAGATGDRGRGVPQDANAGPEALFRMGALTQDDLDERHRLRADLAPCRLIRSGLQSAWRWWLDGIWSCTVVCLRFDEDRTCTATCLPRWNSSTVRAVIRPHIASPSSMCEVVMRLHLDVIVAPAQHSFHSA